MAQPGIKIIDGNLYANANILEAAIYYTTDGSEPTEQSQLWTKSIACDARQIKAKAFYLGKKNVTALLISDYNRD